MMTDYSLYTTSDLIEELRKYTNAYALIFIRHDEDIGPNAIKTNISCFESSKMQIFGLASRMYWWMRTKSRTTDDIKMNIPKDIKDIDNQILNRDGKEIIDSLKNRSEAGVCGIVFKDNHEVFFVNWEKHKGQSTGLATELHDKIMS